jgi:peptidoglycan/xylan/chitin deacetylase (PgdA/CDA1 family)
MRRCKQALILLTIIFISGCGIPDKLVTPSFLTTGTSTLTFALPSFVPPSVTPIPTNTATVTVTVAPTPVWVFQSGTITCPILLYHRIADPPVASSLSARYYTSPADFSWQLQVLRDLGYSTIPIIRLVEAIIKGAQLPPRPVVISFDDGDESVFKNAYPLMQAQGFTGVIYLVWSYIGSQDYMDINQIQTLVGNGWEIGSHSMTHPHLTEVHDQIQSEAGLSKVRLQNEIGVSVDTFAYPYGEIDPFIINKISDYGYLAAVGLGTQSEHSLDTLYYLSRIEVRNAINRSAFTALLPWVGVP